MRAGSIPTLPSYLVGPQNGMVLWLDAAKQVGINDATIADPCAFETANWGKVSCSVTANSATDPAGASAADSLVEAVGASNHNIAQLVTNRVAGVTETYSVYAKAGARNWVFVGDAGATQGTFVNLTTGALGTTFGGVREVLSVGNGWFRIAITSATFNGNIGIFMSNADNVFNYVGDGVSNILLYGAAVSQPKVNLWVDQSGAGNNVTQGTAAAQPLLVLSGQNAKPLVRFTSASAHFLKRAATNLFAAGNYSLYGLCKWTAAGTPRQVIFGCTDAATGGMYYGPADGGATGARELGYIGAASQDDAVMSKTLEAFCVRYGGGTDTTLRTNRTDRALSGLAALVDPGGAAAIRLGTYNEAILFLDGDIYEILAWNRKLSQNDHNGVESYLCAKGQTFP